MYGIPIQFIVYALIALGVGGYIWHCESSKTELAQSVAVARAQNAENAKRALREINAKDRSDENYERKLSRLRADVKRLRNTSASGLPAASTAPEGAARACYDRAELDSALRSYRDAVAEGRARLREVIGECGASVEALDEAKGWANDR